MFNTRKVNEVHVRKGNVESESYIKMGELKLESDTYCVQQHIKSKRDVRIKNNRITASKNKRIKFFRRRYLLIENT